MNKGTIRGIPDPNTPGFVSLDDQNYRCSPFDRYVLYTNIVAARTITLPNAQEFGVGVLVIGDASGECNSTRIITIQRAGQDLLTVGSVVLTTSVNISSPSFGISFFSDGVSTWTAISQSTPTLAGDLSGDMSAPTFIQVVGLRQAPLGGAVGSATTGDILSFAAGAWNNGGSLQTYTPTLTQSGTVTKTVTAARYMQLGLMVFGWVRLVPTSAGTANNAILVGLPVTSAVSGPVVGGGLITLAGVQYRLVVVSNTTSTVALKRADVTGTANMGVDPNAALANSGDFINIFFMYEAA